MTEGSSKFVCESSSWYVRTWSSLVAIGIVVPAFTVLFLCYFQQLQLLIVKNFELYFVFVLCGVFFSRFVQIKCSFSDEKSIRGEI